LAAHIVALLRSGLNLSSAEVRCTSVDGYRLPGGADTDDQLRLEVHNAEAFVGIVSTASLQSPYVLFELGARWGAGKQLVPLLAPGTPASVLGGPLAGLNALRSDSRAQLQQLVTDLAQTLGIRPEVPAGYEANIEAILALTVQDNPEAPAGKPATAEAQDVGVPDEATQILTALSRHERARIGLVASAVGQSEQRTRYFLDTLIDRGLVDAIRAMGSPPAYFLTQAGRAYLFEKGLLA
jgi:hypothetical protein